MEILQFVNQQLRSVKRKNGDYEIDLQIYFTISSSNVNCTFQQLLYAICGEINKKILHFVTLLISYKM